MTKNVRKAPSMKVVIRREMKNVMTMKKKMLSMKVVITDHSAGIANRSVCPLPVRPELSDLDGTVVFAQRG